MKKQLENKVYTIFMLAFGIFVMLELACYFTNNTFSRYSSKGLGETPITTAVPIVEDTIEEITIPLSSMIPGSVETYSFSVKNFNNVQTTEVTMNYNIAIEATDYLPLVYTLAKNSSNVSLTDGITPWFSLPHSVETTDNYVLTITWPSNLNVFNYANLVEIITITIYAEQAVGI